MKKVNEILIDLLFTEEITCSAELNNLVSFKYKFDNIKLSNSDAFIYLDIKVKNKLYKYSLKFNIGIN